ncbi:MAG: MoxR family ATPase [Emcibacter sp.]|nr:MoxR family ATPase [Emcibacter sp.]
MSTPNNQTSQDAHLEAGQFVETFNRIRSQIQNMMVGQDEVIEGVLIAMMAGGHVLIEGVPGLGKTMLVKTLSDVVNLKFSRIQFTPDMMPADIQGTQVLVDTEGGGHELTFQEGPLVSSLVLADEINRATPKTQSALLEAMQEHQITVGRRTIKLDEPYCVMATQNPVEQEGTYPLPEAQLDRFLFKLIVGYPSEQEYHDILDRTTGTNTVLVEGVSSGDEIIRMREIVRAVSVPKQAKTYAVRLIMGTQPGSDYAPDAVNSFVALGASPRGVQGLILAAKVKALLAGRYAVSVDDIRSVTHPVLRHRIVMNFHGQSDDVTTDNIIEKVLGFVKTPDGLA